MEFPGEPGVGPAGLTVVGWKEYLDFPEWGVRRVKAKVDSGARTSALDVARYTLERRPEGLFARMELALNRHRRDKLVTVETAVLRLVVVTSSDGVREERPVIEVAANQHSPVYFWFAQRHFVLVRSAVYECPSAHSNPTVVAAQRRTDFVLV